MTIAEIQEIGKIVTSAGSTGKEVMLMYLGERVISNMLGWTIGVAVTIAVYKLISRAISVNYGNDKIARHYDGSSYLSSKDIDKICAILDASEECQKLKAQGHTKYSYY